MKDNVKMRFLKIAKDISLKPNLKKDATAFLGVSSMLVHFR